MAEVMYYLDGLEHLMKEFDQDRLALFRINSRQNSSRSQVYIDLIGIKGIHFPEERIFRYTPPEWTTHSLVDKDGNPFQSRQEEIPHITDTSLVYIIFDDVIDMGNTLACASLAIERQGIPQGQIWSFGDIRQYSEKQPILDRVESILKYLERQNRYNPIHPQVFHQSA